MHSATIRYKTMKYLITFIAFAFSILLAGQSYAQSSWGTQDTSINWTGFDWRDLGIGGYDTNSDGFGTVGTGLNLGNLDPGLQGLTVDVAVGRTDDSTNSRWITSNGTTLSSALSGGIQVRFSFSQPVAFRRRPLSTVAFGQGEIETYVSSSLDYIEQGGNLNLVAGNGAVNSIDAIPPAGLGSFVVSAEDYDATFFAVTWDDDVGAALTQALHFEIGVPTTSAVPEPSSLILSASLFGGLLMRRRRKS